MHAHLKRSVVEVLYILLGTCLAGFAIATFILPAKIASGGVNGIATIIYHLMGWEPGLVMLVISIPLFVLGLFIFGKLYGFKSLGGTVLLSFWVSLFGRLTAYRGFLPYTDRMDTLLSAIFGGVLLGSGIGIVMRSGANTGGTDIIAQIVSRFTPLPLEQPCSSLMPSSLSSELWYLALNAHSLPSSPSTSPVRW